MKRLTNEQAIALSAFTGIMCCEISVFHEAVEKKLGRPVWTHEFGDKAVVQEVKDAFKEDFMALIPQ